MPEDTVPRGHEEGREEGEMPIPQDSLLLQEGNHRKAEKDTILAAPAVDIVRDTLRCPDSHTLQVAFPAHTHCSLVVAHSIHRDGGAEVGVVGNLLPSDLDYVLGCRRSNDVGNHRWHRLLETLAWAICRNKRGLDES